MITKQPWRANVKQFADLQASVEKEVLIAGTFELD